MESKEEMLKKLGLKTMFNISDEEMPELVEEYDIFMNHVSVLEKIDTTGVEPFSSIACQTSSAVLHIL